MYPVHSVPAQPQYQTWVYWDSSFSIVTFSTSPLQWVLQKDSSQLHIRKKNSNALLCFPIILLLGAVHHIQETTASALDVLIRTTATGHVSEKPTERHVCNKQGCTSEVPTSQTLYYPALDIQLCFDILCTNIIKRTGDEGRPWKSPTPSLKMRMLDFVQKM